MIVTRENRVRLGAAAILAVVFGAGLAIGVAVDRDPAPTARDGDEVAAEDRDASLSSGWIIDHLELTPEQQARVDSVVSHYGRHMSDIQKDFRPRFRSVVDSTNRALMQILTDQQHAQYDSIEGLIQRRRAYADSVAGR